MKTTYDGKDNSFTLFNALQSNFISITLEAAE